MMRNGIEMIIYKSAANGKKLPVISAHLTKKYIQVKSNHSTVAYAFKKVDFDSSPP